MRVLADSSWAIKKLFTLRIVGQNMVKHVIGNVESTWLWLDNWHHLGPLNKTFGEVVVFILGSHFC